MRDSPISVDVKRERRKKLFLTAYERKDCVVVYACKATGIGRRTYQDWRKADKRFHEACLDLEEKNLDLSEDVIFTARKAGNISAAMFHLKCKGKARGWIERQEITGAEGVPLHSGVSAEQEQRLRSLSLDDLKRIRDIIRDGATVPTAPAGPDRSVDRGEEPPRVH